jgi:hypothetical protein
MIENVEIVYLQPPESARFVNISPSSSAQYVVYSTSTSLLPSSYDQVLKNNVLLMGVPADSLQPFGPSAADESEA